jgi:hypothetical protein
MMNTKDILEHALSALEGGYGKIAEGLLIAEIKKKLSEMPPEPVAFIRTSGEIELVMKEALDKPAALYMEPKEPQVKHSLTINNLSIQSKVYIDDKEVSFLTEPVESVFKHMEQFKNVGVINE